MGVLSLHVCEDFWHIQNVLAILVSLALMRPFQRFRDCDEGEPSIVRVIACDELEGRHILVKIEEGDSIKRADKEEVFFGGFKKLQKLCN
jgi:hypothetical protein